MVREGEIRRNEVAVDWPGAGDAGLVFIGRIHTPWGSRLVTPLSVIPPGCDDGAGNSDGRER